MMTIVAYVTDTRDLMTYDTCERVRRATPAEYRESVDDSRDGGAGTIIVEVSERTLERNAPVCYGRQKKCA